MRIKISTWIFVDVSSKSHHQERKAKAEDARHKDVPGACYLKLER
jgi:hypothetical protein